MHALLRRESACPVHFLWDGIGIGRMLVRFGFLGFVIAGMIATLSTLLRVEAPVWIAVVIAGGLWTVGQVFSFAAAARLERQRAR